MEIAEVSVQEKIPFVCCSPEEIQVPQGWNDKWSQFGFDIPRDDNSSRKRLLLNRKTPLKKSPDRLKLEIFKLFVVVHINGYIPKFPVIGICYFGKQNSVKKAWIFINVGDEALKLKGNGNFKSKAPKNC